ncbi:MAG: sulfotransferase family 2 domain-containing protein [Parvularculaceae bacterium]
MLTRISARIYYNLPRRLRWKLARDFGGQPKRWVQWIYDSPGEYSLRAMRARNCIFIHIPKAAGTAIATSLFGNKCGAHASASDYLSVFGGAWYDGAFKFTFVRDPWSRTASAFKFLRAGYFDGSEFRPTVRQFVQDHLSAYEDFEHFVFEGLGRPEIMAWPHFRPQVRFLTDPRTGRLGVDFIGRYETLRQDYETICAKLGVSIALAERNVTEHGSDESKMRMSEKSCQRISEIYEEDIVNLGYERFTTPLIKIASA